MSRSRRSGHARIAGMATVLGSAMIGSTQAATYTWISSSTGNYSASTNWSSSGSNVAPVSASDTTLTFTGAGTYTATNDLGTTLASPLLVNTIQIGGAGTPTLSGGFIKFAGTTPTITRVAGAGSTPGITSTLVLDNGVNLAISGTGTNQLNINSTGKITGQGGLTVNGGTLVMISGASDYSGGTTLSSGEIVLFNNTTLSGSTITGSPVGTGTLTLNGGAIRTNAGNTRTLYNALQIGGNVALGNASSANDITFNGVTTLTGAPAVHTLTVSGIKKLVGAIGDAGAGKGLTFAGTGTLTLGGGAADVAANTYSGLTTLSAGALVLDKASNTNAIAGNLTVSGGTLTWSRSHQLANASTLTVGAATVDVKVDETIGALTLNNAAAIFNTSSTLTSNTIGVTGAVSISANATLNVNSNSTLNAGSLSQTSGTINSAGTTTVTGAAGIAATANITAGSFSAGTLNITGGTTTASAGASVSAGALNVSVGTLTTAAPVTVTGNVSSSSNVNVNSTSFSANAVNITGGSFKSTGATSNLSVNSLSITGGTSAVAASSHQIAGTLNVGSGGLSITQPTGRSAIFGALAMNSGGVAGTLKLSGNVTFNSSGNPADNYATRITQGAEGYVDLNGAERTFTIADGTVLEDLAITAIVKDGVAGSGGGIRKKGAGGLALGFANPYSGQTIVEAGKLLVYNYNATPSLVGSATGSGAVSILGGATLGGNGRVAGDLAVSGIVDPNKPSSSGGTGVITTPNPNSILTVSDVTFSDGGELHLDLGSSNDQLIVEAMLDLTSGLDKLTLSGTPTTVPEAGLVLVQYDDIAGTFNSVTGVPSGYSVIYTSSDGPGAIVLAVPEPGSMALLALGSLAMLRRRRR